MKLQKKMKIINKLLANNNWSTVLPPITDVEVDGRQLPFNTSARQVALIRNLHTRTPASPGP